MAEAAARGPALPLYIVEPGLVLARRFIDYEPGIHWSQCQMQSGATDIDTIRVYNPIKQGRDQDPDGRFGRRWYPELAGVKLPCLFTPWIMPQPLQAAIGGRIGHDYPPPVLDQAAAARRARERVWDARRTAGFGDTADAIQARHGSRRSGIPGATSDPGGTDPADRPSRPSSRPSAATAPCSSGAPRVERFGHN